MPWVWDPDVEETHDELLARVLSEDEKQHLERHVPEIHKKTMCQHRRMPRVSKVMWKWGIAKSDSTIEISNVAAGLLSKIHKCLRFPKNQSK